MCWDWNCSLWAIMGLIRGIFIVFFGGEQRAARPCQWNCCSLCFLWAYCSSELCSRLFCSEIYLELEGFLKGGEILYSSCRWVLLLSCLRAFRRYSMGLFLKENTHWDDMLTDHRVVKLDGFYLFIFIKDCSKPCCGTITELYCSSYSLIGLTTKSWNRYWCVFAK